MIFNTESNTTLLKRIFYSKTLQKGIEKTKFITILFALVFGVVSIMLFSLCLLFKNNFFGWLSCLIIWISVLLIEFFIYILAIYLNYKKIKFFLIDRYKNWKLKIYLLSSDNISNFDMQETIEKNIFICTYRNTKFTLEIEDKLIKIVKNDALIEINNFKLDLFNHNMILESNSIFFQKKEIYFDLLDKCITNINKFVMDDFKYILDRIYENN